MTGSPQAKRGTRRAPGAGSHGPSGITGKPPRADSVLLPYPDARAVAGLGAVTFFENPGAPVRPRGASTRRVRRFLRRPAAGCPTPAAGGSRAAGGGPRRWRRDDLANDTGNAPITG